MTKRKITLERREQRKKLLELLQDAGINDVAGVQELFKEMVGTVLENGLEGELDEERRLQQIRLPEQGHGQQPQRIQRENTQNQHGRPGT